jgi:hypothetical protein
MIIWGFRVVFRMLSEGTFFCPSEQLDRSYKLKSAQRFFTLFFIPLIPLKKLGNVVECQSCKAQFDPAVLEQPIQAEVGPALADSIRAATLSVLRAGTLTDSRREQAVRLVSHYVPSFDDNALTTELESGFGTTALNGATPATANVYEKEGLLTRLTLVALGDEKRLTDEHRHVLETIGGQTFAMSRPHVQGTIDSVVAQVNGK